MSHPRRYLLFMFLYLAVVGLVCTLLFEPLKSAFMANWAFNLLILGALVVGIIINLHQVIRLEPELKWMQIFRTGQAGLSMADTGPVMLKPLIKHLSGIHRDRFRLSAFSLRTVLDGVRAHLDESREIAHYMVGLLIFLGLLGTFWGLLGTIGAVGNVIGGLEVGSSRDFALVFSSLKAGLQAPLKGMGTAFSSSLFGLGGSLVLGFLDIQASHAQNRFFNEMEEWLSGVTQLIDEEEAPDLEPEMEKDRLDSIERHLKLLINEIRKSQRSIERIMDTTESPRGKK